MSLALDVSSLIPLGYPKEDTESVVGHIDWNSEGSLGRR